MLLQSGIAAHRMTGLRVVTLAGTVTGDATLGTRRPFPLEGALKLASVATLHEARVDLAANGTLSSLTVDIAGQAGEGRVTGRAALAPLAAVPLVSLALDARDIDLFAWEHSLPSTRIAATINTQPIDGGLSGTAGKSG